MLSAHKAVIIFVGLGDCVLTQEMQGEQTQLAPSLSCFLTKTRCNRPGGAGWGDIQRQLGKLPHYDGETEDNLLLLLQYFFFFSSLIDIGFFSRQIWNSTQRAQGLPDHSRVTCSPGEDVGEEVPILPLASAAPAEQGESLAPHRAPTAPGTLCLRNRPAPTVLKPCPGAVVSPAAGSCTLSSRQGPPRPLPRPTPRVTVMAGCSRGPWASRLTNVTRVNPYDSAVHRVVIHLKFSVYCDALTS